MSRVDAYLAHAAAAEAKAAKLDGEFRLHVLNLARKWRDLAEQARREIESEADADAGEVTPEPQCATGHN